MKLFVKNQQPEFVNFSLTRKSGKVGFLAKKARRGPKNQNFKKSLLQIFLIIFYYNLTKFYKKTSYLSGVIFKNVILRYCGLKFNILQKSQIFGT